MRDPHSIPVVVVLAAVALATAACSKSDSPTKTSAAPAAAKQAAAPSTLTAEPDAGLRERLARQEAAAKMFDPKKPAPAPAAAPATPASTATPAAAPAPAPAPAVATKPAEPVKAAPEKAPPPVASRPEPEAPKPANVAAAKPSSAAPAPAPAAEVVRLVSRVDPDFPREAAQAGADNGLVKARLTLDQAGNVTRVEVVEAQPRRVFDRAVTRALSQWKFNEGANGRTFDTEIVFKR
jgi:protein TonB